MKIYLNKKITNLLFGVSLFITPILGADDLNHNLKYVLKPIYTNYSSQQIQNLQIAYSIGKITRAEDGTTFEKTLPSIMLRESSAKNNIIGDDKNKNGSKRSFTDSSLGVMQVRVSTAREISKKVTAMNWVNKLSDHKIANMLKNNNQFNILIAAHYIRINYNLSLRRKYIDPIFKTISRYNGGWHNKTYYSKVIKNMKSIKKLIKKGILK